MSWGNPGRRRSRRDEDDRDDEFDFPLNLGDIDRLIENMLRTAKTLGRENGPIYYGYSVTTGADGKPHVREFGNLKPTRKGTLELGSREAFVDTVLDEKENKLKIIAEMPGVEREEIQLEVLEDSLSIRAEHRDRRYDTTVPITTLVDPSSASATYNNGILEVVLGLKPDQGSRGVRIRVN